MSMHSLCFLSKCKKHTDANEELTVGQIQVYTGQRSKEEHLAQNLFELGKFWLFKQVAVFHFQN